ncbi:hypothetical protein B7L68_05355 [Thermoproteus sp. CP80]|uniref:hypothetical protein n=1 Tax=Thermoproteus sp. CP80 TaxID=1650659 RepID=UPI0009BDE2AD|nr:hypothetical protein [Thermoproteus sp. CP80]PLC64101.1 hypothetical protein B7L68_05355 [Thermoproteus sp. CP80]
MERSVDEIRRRLELALRPAEPPSLDEVLAAVGRNGKLRGPADWAFPAWIAYVEYAAQRIAEAFQLTEEERRQLFHFRDTLKRLLLEAWGQAKAKLTAIYKAVVEGTYRVEGNKLYAPDGAWMYIGRTVMHIPIHGISAETYFPDVLKLPREKLELFQLGWRASDEGNEKGRPFMGTTQPWQVFAWTAARYGALRIHITSANLTHEGVSVAVHLSANSWRQRWSKDEAVDLVASHLRRGEWAPLLTMWLGDGKAERKKVLRGKYKIVIAAKEPWRLGNNISTREALVARGREAFERLREAAGAYGVLLDLLRAHKWINVKLATDDAFRAAYKLKARKRGIDVLREAYGRNGEIPTEFSHMERPRRGAVAVTGVVMSLYLVSGQGVSLLAGRYVRDVGKALAVAGRLESAGLRPNVVRVGSYYMVYIATTDLLRLAERDEAVRRAIALYLAEKAKNGTPRQKEVARKLLQRHPLFLSSQSPHRLLEAGIAMR